MRSLPRPQPEKTVLAITTAAPVTTSVPPTEASTTSEPPTTTTTEALSSAETRLADGSIKGVGFIDRVWEADGGRHLSIDYGEFLSFWSDSPPEGAGHLRDVPWWIIRPGAQVIKIDEQYIP